MQACRHAGKKGTKADTYTHTQRDDNVATAHTSFYTTTHLIAQLPFSKLAAATSVQKRHMRYLCNKDHNHVSEQRLKGVYWII